MEQLPATSDSKKSDRKPLKTISNRKRQSSLKSDSIHPHKKQKIACRKSSKSKPKKKRSLKEEDKKEKDNDPQSHFLSKYTSKTITIERIFDNERFDEEAYEECDGKSRKLKFKILFQNGTSDNNWIRLTDIFSNAFKYSSKSNPTSNDTKKEFVDALKLFLKRNCISDSLDSFYTKFNKKVYISEKGFCILLVIMTDFDQCSVNVQHFCFYRFYYRRQIFGTKITGFNVKKPRSIKNIEICTSCCLEDIARNFNFANPCDCGCALHLNCTQIQPFTVPVPDNTNNDAWFCPFCVKSGLSMNELIERRNNFNKNAEFEVEKVIDYDIIDDQYTVKWKNYPNEACCKTEASFSFMELVDEYWQNKKVPLKAQNIINFVKQENESKAEVGCGYFEDENENEDVDISSKMGNLEINNDDNQDIDMKSNEDKFIAVQLEDIMNEKYIIRRQKYTTDTYERMKMVTKRYRKWLQKEVKKESCIGMHLKRGMKLNKYKQQMLPKYHLRSVNRVWDCDLPRIRDIILTFLCRDWRKWDHNVSNKSFVIGEITDAENPAKKYGVHSRKAYGLFATEKIVCDTLLFEYAGCVKRVGAASQHLEHLERELGQTTLFDLIGHLDEKRSKLFWGKKGSDQLVIDPARWHNEGVYMNDYRDHVMADPDADELDENPAKNNNQTRKQNVKFFEVLVNNWPRVFAVAIQDVEVGEELLGDYGASFWRNFRVMMKRQKQLCDIKQRINNEWEEKYEKLLLKCNRQEKEIEKFKKCS